MAQQTQDLHSAGPNRRFGDKLLRTLEFDKVRALLRPLTATPFGRDLVDALIPSSQPDLRDSLKTLSEWVKRLDQDGPLPLSGAAKPPLLDRLGVDGYIYPPEESLQLARTLDVSRVVRAAGSSARDDLPRFAQVALEMPDLRDLSREIGRRIGEDAKVRDDASGELQRIRRTLDRTRVRVREQLQRIIREGEAAQAIQEPVISMRNGRYVIPVRAERQSRIRGVVHDHSSSGATVFVEPFATVERNNEIQRLSDEDRDEVRRILLELSNRIRSEAGEILEAIRCLGEVDLYQAKALLSQRYEGSEPEFVEDGRLVLRDARHPLLDARLASLRDLAGIGATGGSRDTHDLSESLGGPKPPSDAVPLSIELGPACRSLVITGPNTGGKTVALKTAGLMALMAQAGLHLPAAAGCRLPLYDSIFADIGDEQDVVQNLSTFSSHVTKIARMVRELEGRCLVLLDEVGAGTDPGEGGPLGVAMLEYFHSRGAHVLVTTHYNMLKLYAHSREGVENASVEFDANSLSPTYRLSVGLPGRSNALEIAGRIGLDKEILTSARSYMEGKELKLDEFLRQTEERLESLDRQQAALAEARDRLDEVKVRRDAALDRWQEMRDRELDALRAQADEILADLGRRGEKLLSRLREEAVVPKSAEKKLKNELRTLDKTIPRPRPASKKAPVSFKELDAGQWVTVDGLSDKGRVLLPWKKGKHPVALEVRGKTLWVSASQIKPVDRPASSDRAEVKGASGSWIDGEERKIESEINLLGCTVDEALSRVDKLLDDAVIGDLIEVRIIHGFGTGRLKEAIAAYLKEHQLVAGYRSADMNAGGGGVTEVTLKTQEKGSPVKGPGKRAAARGTGIGLVN